MSTIAEKLKTTYLGLAGLTTSIRQLLSVGAKEVTSQEINNKLNNVAQESTSQEILEEVQSSSEALQSIVDANILRPNLQGISFVDGTATDDVAALIVGGAPNITSISSEEYSGGIRQYVFSGCSSLYEVNLPLATSIGASAFQSCSSLREVNFPLVTSIGVNAFNSCSSLRKVNFPLVTSMSQQALAYCPNLREVNSPLVTSIGANALGNCGNLIKLSLGTRLANSLSLTFWNPTNAYSTTSRSLIPEDVQAEHPLWYNLDYLLYNIRECIAANLPDRTGQTALTITFNATMKGHINNSQETIDAFNNKNWIIA